MSGHRGRALGRVKQQRPHRCSTRLGRSPTNTGREDNGPARYFPIALRHCLLMTAESRSRGTM